MSGDMVFDACAIAKLLFLEAGSHEARILATQADVLITSELAFLEVGNVALKKLRRGEISKMDAASVVGDCKALIDQHVPAVELADEAMALALRAMVSIYDASYVVLAARLNATLVTSDGSLVRALTGVPNAPKIVLLPA
jgi:predicted nucleic acid-binding protein